MADIIVPQSISRDIIQYVFLKIENGSFTAWDKHLGQKEDKILNKKITC